jgi:hypothetical protein
MNRDEVRSRGVEIPPTIDGRKLPMLGPRDSDRGGMWIAVNDAGVVACLTNAYYPGDYPCITTMHLAPSRGRIVPVLLQHGEFRDVCEAFQDGFDPSPYLPFTVVICSIERTFSQTWTGAELLPCAVTDQPRDVFVSSSWKASDVAAWRRCAFAQWCKDGCPVLGGLPVFHILQPAGEAAWSPLMDRDESATRSITQILVDAVSSNAVMRYWPRSVLPHGAPLLNSLPLNGLATRGAGIG